MNAKERRPDDFDWVTARAGCSIGVIFEKLKSLIQQDVETRNSNRETHVAWAFRFIDEGKGSFSVLVEGSKIHLTIKFILDRERISVFRADGKMFDVFATLSNDGECRAKIDNQEYDLWQVRKMSLEDFFFKNYFESQ